NPDDEDACLTSCQEARCGDGVVQVGVEECDDGNATGGDGCSPTCEVENAVAPPDDGCSAGGRGRNTGWLAALGALFALRPRQRRARSVAY
ncbi:MAG: DUF4215 domain-containing protein, partial [Rhodoglobus sp.]